MTKWENMSVTITQTSDIGGQINFDDAPNQPPHFRFRGVYLPAKNSVPMLSHYVVEFDSGYMVDWWSGVSLFPLGTEPPAPVGPLHPYNDSLETMLLYRKALAAFRPQPTTERLEGYMGVIYPNIPCVDRVSVYYHKGAVQRGDGTTSDLVEVRFSYADDRFQPLENGGGNGPPH